MSSLSANSKRVLVIVLVALAAVASGGVSWKIGHDYDERREAEAIRSLGFGVQPTVLWNLDARRLTDRPGDVLLPVATPDTSTNGFGMLVDSSTDLIAAVGQPRDYYVVADVTLVGIDRAHGSPTWKRAVGPVRQCTAGPVTDTIACWSPTRVIILDSATGRVRSDSSPDFEITRVDLSTGSAYISGTRGRGATISAVIAHGTVDSPMSSVRVMSTPGKQTSVGEVSAVRNLLVVDEVSGSETTAPSTVYSLDTGARRFTVDDGVRTIGDTLFRSQLYPEGRIERLVADNGSTVQSQALSLPGGSFQPQVLATSFAPVVMGDGVFDPRSGALLWRDPVLDWGRAVGGITPAIIGDVLVAGSLDGTLIGMNARTGRRLWTTPWRSAFFVRVGITDGRYLVFGDESGMHSLDTITGQIVWSVPTPPTSSLALTYVSGSGGDIVRSTKVSISVWRARNGPDPA